MPLFRNTPAPDTEGDLPLNFSRNFPGLLGTAESERDLELLSLDPTGMEVRGEEEEEEREGGGEDEKGRGGGRGDEVERVGGCGSGGLSSMGEGLEVDEDGR